VQLQLQQEWRVVGLKRIKNNPATFAKFLNIVPLIFINPFEALGVWQTNAESTLQVEERSRLS